MADNITDDGIRERHGMKCQNADEYITIIEREDRIEIPTYPRKRDLTIWQARYLARKLYRLARRIEKRADA